MSERLKGKRKPKITGAYATNPITQADKKQKGTNVPIPDEFDVAAAKKRVDENHL